MSKFKVYAISILIPVLIGGVIGLITSSAIDYNTLKQPSLAPPSWLFPVVWTILYILMGVSYGILKSNSQANEDIDLIYYLQLGVNALWSIIFFTLKWKLLSVFWIILLDVLVVKMVIEFYNKNKTAAYLQIPYLIWLAFATYLNIGVYFLNR